MRLQQACAILLACMVAPASRAETSEAPPAPPVSESNWRTHPRIVEVRELVASVEEDLRQKRLVAKVKESPCAGLTSTLTMYSDASGRVRRLVANAGSGDSAYTLTATYDAQGAVRFVFIQGGAVSDSTLDQRFWLDDQSRRLWSSEDAKGPGWTWWRPTKKTWDLLKKPSQAQRVGACELLS